MKFMNVSKVDLNANMTHVRTCVYFLRNDKACENLQRSLDANVTHPRKIMRIFICKWEISEIQTKTDAGLAGLLARK